MLAAEMQGFSAAQARFMFAVIVERVWVNIELNFSPGMKWEFPN